MATPTCDRQGRVMPREAFFMNPGRAVVNGNSDKQTRRQPAERVVPPLVSTFRDFPKCGSIPRFLSVLEPFVMLRAGYGTLNERKPWLPRACSQTA
jgi:hypothetical protein